MPILVFASTRELLTSAGLQRDGLRLLIEVSRVACSAIEDMVEGADGRLTTEHLPALTALRSADLYSSELALLIQAVERDGQAFVRFI